ncbi:McrB family protein [Alkalibacterium putridalgicola]|uniref:McrB family protein n=1 Tax=Alkalibacterium putridalgicola TaxID=426703 RepID=UPI0034CD2884
MLTEEQVITRLQEIFPSSKLDKTKYYTSLQVINSKGIKRNFVELHFYQNNVKIALIAKFLNDEEKQSVDIKPENFRWTLNGEVSVTNINELNDVIPLIEKSYVGVKNADSDDNSMSLAEKHEKEFKDWAIQRRVNKGKKETDWDATVPKTIWLRGSTELVKFKKNIDLMPIKDLLLKVSNLNTAEIEELNSLPNNLFSLEKDKFIEAHEYINNFYKKHSKELREIINNTNLDGSRRWGYSIFKNTAFANEYLTFLNESNVRSSNPVSKYRRKLLSSKNIILRGAPGTGKTYLARRIAAEIISGGRTKDFNELSNDEQRQFEFVQFHPSYDYTDFVEGLRPINDETNGQIGFELVPGVFKKFVTLAKESKLIGGNDNFDEAWSKFFEEVHDITSDDSDATYDIKTLTGKDMHLQAYVHHGMEGVQEVGTHGYYNKNQCYLIYQNKPGVPKGGLDNYRKAIVKHLRENFGLQDYVPKHEEAKEVPFVFVIDEINRDEISKIFGELFFSIDPGYRGMRGAVKTQYASLHEDEEELFYIPENVYIIGTMNDIDRSVENFDFAMRRRFRFVKIKANDPDQLGMLSSLDYYDEAVERLEQLNKRISSIEGLNDHYHIGPSYFLKLDELDSDFDLLWEDYLEPLLEEYVRGFLDEEEILQELREAYEFASVETEGLADEDYR